MPTVMHGRGSVMAYFSNSGVLVGDLVKIGGIMKKEDGNRNPRDRCPSSKEYMWNILKYS